MRYIKQNKIYTIEDIRQENPNMSIPDNTDCSSLGYEFLIEVPEPIQDGYYAVEVAPVNNKQTWELREIEIQVPQSITRLQAKLQLSEIGKFSQVEALIQGNEKAKIYWNDSQNFYRDDEILLNMATALGLTDEQLDDLFLKASKL